MGSAGFNYTLNWLHIKSFLPPYRHTQTLPARITRHWRSFKDCRQSVTLSRLTLDLQYHSKLSPHTHSQSITSDEGHTLLLSSTKFKRINLKFNLHKFSKNNNLELTNHFQTLLFEERDSNSSCSQFLKSWHFKGQDFISATAKLLFWIPATCEEDNHLFHSVCINSCLFGQKLVKTASAEVLKSVSIYAGGKNNW